MDWKKEGINAGEISKFLKGQARCLNAEAVAHQHHNFYEFSLEETFAGEAENPIQAPELQTRQAKDNVVLNGKWFFLCPILLFS